MGKQKVKFVNYKKYQKGLKELFSFIQMEPENQTAVASSIIMKNGIILLSGVYGTGKTQLVNLIKKLFFSDGKGNYDYDYETCHQDLTAFDVLYHLDLAELQKGREIVHPKKMVSARMKFLNEIQRANPAFYNSMLSLLSERKITYRDEVFESPPYVFFMDRNPLDSGSTDIPKAFLDRIDIMINFSTIDIKKSINLLKVREKEYGMEWDSLETLVKDYMTSDMIEEIWYDVIKVGIDEKIQLLANFLIKSFSVCLKVDRSQINKYYLLDCDSCKFKGEICSHILEVPGVRGINSLLKFAQARAWLAKRESVDFKDLIFALPFILSHRVEIKKSELSLYENEYKWIKEKAIEEILMNKFENWQKIAEDYFNKEFNLIRISSKEDLVVRELLKEE